MPLSGRRIYATALVNTVKDGSYFNFQKPHVIAAPPSTALLGDGSNLLLYAARRGSRPSGWPRLEN